MKKQGSALLLVALLLALPGCGGRDACCNGKDQKAGKMNKGRRMAEAEDARRDADVLAEADDALASFFEMDELVALADDADFADDLAWGETAEDRLETVYFEWGKDAVDADQDVKVAMNAEKAKELLEKAREEDPDARLVIDGYACSSAGTEEYNRAISERRAQRVAAKLVEAGVDADALQVVGRGWENPVVDAGDRDEQWCNRRVEVSVVHA